ncbi:MAG: hypothetical protein C0614_08145 [Desulfuromonas sp.]|nr:MAG: hypothetical protein C0614_08145 [Desulfuromonas sp.]
MPAKHSIDTEIQLLVTTWEGDAIDTDFSDVLIAYQKEIQENPEYADYNEIADFREITSIKITPKGLMNIGKIAAKTDLIKGDCRLALIVNQGLAFNLARIYATYRSLNKSSKKEVRIFNNMDCATKWATETPSSPISPST